MGTMPHRAGYFFFLFTYASRYTGRDWRGERD